MPATTTSPADSDEASAGGAGKENAHTIALKSANASSASKRKRSKGSGLQIDTASASRKQLNPSPTTQAQATTPTTPAAQDTHPYARGAVIEVWHVAKANDSTKTTEDWWSEPDSSDEDDDDKGERTIRLCDIIDRSVVTTSRPGGEEVRYKYYVHYRDFNRRMDEWITVDRIVSPPSIGNAKARALKREEERLKKKQQRKAELEKAAAAVEDLQPRSRRRSSLVTDQQASGPGGGGVGPSGGGAGSDDGGDGSASRRRRPSRRKSVQNDDDATVVASNQVDGSAEMGDGSLRGQPLTESNSSSSKNKKELVALPTDVTTHTVGEHVVATVKAQELDEHEGLDEASLREHEEVTKVKNVNYLELGEYQMETWYFSPLPKELLGPTGFMEVLYVCEFTFRMFARKSELRRFQRRLPTERRHPPGNEIYRKDNIAMFEVDGLEEKIYCQNLCYIAKLFLDHKTLYFDVDPFLFYVLCEIDDRGFHPVGYYSKEKYSDVGYNLACILTFPAHQRKGYGRFLIAFSYELTKKEEKVGSPEKPMSDLGQQAYKPYWASTVVDFLLNQSNESYMSIMDISKKTSIMAEDIVFTLNQLGILKIINGVYFIAAEKSLLEGLAKKYPVKKPIVDPSRLHWTPFLTDVKRDKFSIHSKKPSVEAEERRGNGGF